MSAALLEWYDAHARVLPWRVPPGSDARADPYGVWLSEVMLQQTTVAAVKDYFHTFTRLWPTVDALAAARDEDVMARWAGLGYYARARNLLKCARVVAERGGFPESAEGLRELPGIGPYTAAAVAAIAFDRPEVVVDGNVERVMARLHAVQEPLPAAKPVLTAHAAALTPKRRPGDYAQAVMDLGATICTPKSPACGICPWREPCAARVEGIAAELPKKTPKKPKPVRLGHAYVIRRADGAFLLERRPKRGLLGGMLGWPGAEWREEPAAAAPPVEAALHEIGEVRHTFTHFHLILRVHAGRAEVEAPEGLHWERLSPAALPTVMRKAYDLAATSAALDVAGD
ncbi:A/G-specific adenine glycosylase [Oceanicola sp. D3]|uniref:A/G-specific adenine glycosylase n=1 Tax=Oceanicola sp. D3 TaxID=2587163 RepID=UPI00111F5F29|nr:A/G-specific adenine glycosylase [Oceanicola sp. D3]QDC11478.1 A/G-specific adenine glycosylase [Oceanicola sp. D3]